MVFTKYVLAFDIYGTLLDTSSITSVLLQYVGALNGSEVEAREVSAAWRKYQLEYTWRLNSMQVYEPFDAVTRQSLKHAVLERCGVDLSEETVEAILGGYNNLSSFPNAAQVLHELDRTDGVKVVVFSNGTPEMIASALENANFHGLSREVFSVDAVKRFKPAREVYEGLLEEVGKEEHPEECWLVSGNPFDVCGARNCGMNAIWVDRVGAGWQDRLAGIRPSKIVKDLSEIPSLMKVL